VFEKRARGHNCVEKLFMTPGDILFELGLTMELVKRFEGVSFYLSGVRHLLNCAQSDALAHKSGVGEDI
jgi:hypothetical protein